MHKLQVFCNTEEKKEGKVEEEYFGTDVWSIIQDIIGKIINDKGKPVHNLTKENRLEIIKELEKKGIFLIKGAILQVSKSLGISSPTVYKYLEEIRFASNEKQLKKL
jgi:predicted transcriptional regulator YheO